MRTRRVGSGRNWRAHHYVCVPLISGHVKKLYFWLCKVYRVMWPNSTQASKDRGFMRLLIPSRWEQGVFFIFSIFPPIKSILLFLYLHPEKDKGLSDGETIWIKEPVSLYDCVELNPCQPTLDWDTSKKYFLEWATKI